jgi:hypothetical protein
MTTGAAAQNLAAGMLPPGVGQWATATMIGLPATSNVVPTLSIPEGMAFPLLKTGTFDAVGFYLGSAGAATNAIRITITDADPATLRPRNTIRELGTLTLGSGTANKQITFAPLTLNSGLYWIIFVVQGSGTMPSILNSQGGSPYITNDGTPAWNLDYGRYTFPAVASGSLPSPMPAPDTAASNGRRFLLRGA